MKNSKAGWDAPLDISPRRFLHAVAPRTTPTGRGTGREDAAAFSGSTCRLFLTFYVLYFYAHIIKKRIHEFENYFINLTVKIYR